MAALHRLHAARTLAHEGRHEEALQEYIWFFEHAEKETGRLGAVRLSGGLADWAELAKVYPKALQALEAIRDRKTQLLLLRVGEWNMFHEVVSINEYLGCQQQTYSLFKTLAASNEKFAERCFDIALPSILHAGDYELAERFLGDPVEQVGRSSEMLNYCIRRGDQSNDTDVLKSQIDFYAQRIKQIQEVLEGRGRLDEARRVHDLAVESVEAVTLRDAVRAALEPGARRWYEDDDEADVAE
jgi:hypothetical protein